MKKLLFFAAILAVFVTVVSCNKENEPSISVTGIALNKISLSLTEGDEFTLIPTITPENAADKSVNWTSNNEAVATVSSEGVVKALRAGTATVTATTVDQQKTAACSVVVSEGISAVTGKALHISCRNAEIAGKANISGTTSIDLPFGVLYSTSSGILIGAATKIEAKTFDSEYNFTINTEVLEPETTYYYCSYIIQNTEIFYGEVKSFKTLAVSSMIKTEDATDIHPKEAALNAFLDLTDCKYETLEYGFEVTPEGGSAHTVKASNHSGQAFSAKDETLVKNTNYSCVAYVTLDGRTYKSDVKSFTTLGIQACVTSASSNVKCNTATISGALTVASEGSFTKSATLYYSSSASTLEALKSSGTKKTLTLNQDGTYSENLSSLVSNKKYYYAVVSKVDDIEFATDVKSFTTLEIQASITAESSNVSYHTATISGALTVASEGSFTESATLYYSSTASTLEALKSSGTKKTLTLNQDGTYSESLSSLISNTKYNYVVVSKVDDVEFATEVETSTTLAIPETVDLGLSVKWRSWNVGASNPEEYGTYFAWGDVTGQTWNDSSWSGGGFSSYPNFELDTNGNLKPEYDAAHVKLGGSWRMPTHAEQQELYNNCTCTWTSNYNGTGVAGRILTSRKKGYTDQYIFLPAAGGGLDSRLTFAGSYGNYWSSTICSSYAWLLDVSSDGVRTNIGDRSRGFSVRPVTE